MNRRICLFFLLLVINANSWANKRVHEITWASAQLPTKYNHYFVDLLQKELDKQIRGRFKVKPMILEEGRSDKELHQFLENRNRFLDGDTTSPITITNVHSPDLADTHHIYSYNVFDLPFFFDSYDDLEKFFTSEYGKRLVRKLDNKHVKNFGFTYSTGHRVVPSLFKKIEKLSDFKGMTFRTDLGVINREFYKLLGVNVIYEVFSGEYKKVENEDIVDEGDTTPGELFDYFRSDKNDSAQFLNQTNHSFVTSGVVVKKTFYLGLDAQEKDAFEDALEATTKKHRQMVIKDNEKAIKKVKKMGYPSYVLKKSEGKLFIKNNKSFYKKHFKLIGNDITDFKKSFLK